MSTTEPNSPWQEKKNYKYHDCPVMLLCPTVLVDTHLQVFLSSMFALLYKWFTWMFLEEDNLTLQLSITLVCKRRLCMKTKESGGNCYIFLLKAG